MHLQPAWACEPTFGTLCADRGLDVLSSADVELARDAGLRVYVYRNVPARYHRDLFVSSRPDEVKSGAMCDFMRTPCTPPDPPPSEPGYSKPLNEWLTGAKHAADVPLLAKLLALGSLPGVHTDDPAAAHLFVVPFLGGFVERVSQTSRHHLCPRLQYARGSGGDGSHADVSAPGYYWVSTSEGWTLEYEPRYAKKAPVL